MRHFEYRITKHPAEEFTHLVYFCTRTGECEYERLPGDQMSTLEALLNDMGSRGWELVQTFFGENGIVAFWKREIQRADNQ